MESISPSILKLPCRRHRGFTIVELMVASTVLTIALLGVYSIFHQALHVEGRASVRWQQQAAAEAVAEHLARTLERAINVSAEMPTLAAGPDEGEAVYQLTCFVLDAPGLHATGPRPGIHWHRYRWPLEPEEAGLPLLRQTVHWAGSVNVTAGASVDGVDDSDPWADVHPQVVASEVDDVTLRFGRASDPQARWRERWSGFVGDVAIRIQVRVGRAEAKRTIVPAPSGVLLGEQE